MLDEQSAVSATVAGTWQGILVPAYKSGSKHNLSGCPQGCRPIRGYSDMTSEQSQQSPKVHNVCGLE